MTSHPGGVTVFFLAQGKGARWTTEDKLRANLSFLPDLKQLIQVGDETLLRRSLRLFREEGFENLRLVASPELYPCAEGLAGTLTLDDPGRDLVDGIAQLILEAAPAAFAMGDVLFSRNAIRKLARGIREQSSGVLARCDASIITGKQADEVFAFWYDEEYQPTALARVAVMLRHGRPGKPWAIPYIALADYDRAVAAYQLQAPRLWTVKPLIYYINDYTDDIDSPLEYREFFDPMLKCALTDLIP